MKKTLLSLSISALLLSPVVFAKDFVLTDTVDNIEQTNWKITSDELGLKDAPNFTVTKKTLHGGKQEGSTLITIDTKDLQVSVIPTRGMNIYEIKSGDVRYGWKSPVDEIVNPAFMNLEMRNGLGWLDGFNEMMVRCGYEWTGHPVTADGQIYTLHGRAGNTPVSQVEVEIADAAPHEIRVRGLIKESTFKKADLQTMTELRYVPGTNQFSLHDVLTNHADYPHDYQIIYHSNFGTPILEEGARFLAPAISVSPFNDYAKAGVDNWQTYAGPTKGFDEMVFNIKPLSDNNHETLAAVVNKAGDKGASIQFDTRQLPVLTLWKNTDTLKQGYVTGIEPGTSYAYPVTIEREQKRVKQLQPGASAQFDLTYTLLHSPQQVKEVENRIASIQGETKTEIVNTPMAKE